jgi:hypothetical protein
MEPKMHKLKFDPARLIACLAPALASLLFAGCASTEATVDTKAECAAANWETIGLADGRAGRNHGYIAAHRDRCAPHQVVPDLATYERGYVKGLLEYCTKERGYLEGGKGSEYQNACPDEIEGPFLEGYQEGLAAHRSQKEFRRSQMREHALGGADSIARP